MTRFAVPEMSCGHCTAAIEKSIKSIDSTAQVSCDLDDRQVSVDSVLDADALAEAIRQAGYEASPA